MAGEPQTFFEAMLAVHREVETFPKDGWNDQSQYSFAKGDTVVRKSRELLAKHGILWIRTGARVTGPTLALGDIGRMSYVGNVEISGKLWHSAGELPISAEVPIVAMGARPHDKAWAASVTFGLGYLLLGVLNQDRANEEEINNRVDQQESYCTVEVSDECTQLCYTLASMRTTAESLVHHHQVFAAAWKAVALPQDAEAKPANMTPGEGALVLAWLREAKRKLEARKAKRDQQGQDPTAGDAP